MTLGPAVSKEIIFLESINSVPWLLVANPSILLFLQMGFLEDTKDDKWASA